jgi:pimeloyl-ACP methyl ester carboxylesterase
MANSELLGARHTVNLPSGTIEYAERGTGAPVLFVHGLLVNGDLWRNVVPVLADAGFRCVTPDWPLGSHTVPMPPAADLSPPGVARLIAEFLDVLDLSDVTVVANDTGGALVQILMTQHPTRLGRVVLTPCDAFEDFFPPGFAALPKLAAIPGSMRLMARVLQVPVLQRSRMGFGMTVRQPIPDHVLRSYVGPCGRSAQIRRDLKRFLRGVHKRYTLAAAKRLPAFGKPVLLVSAADDRIFGHELADRLAALLPDASQVTVADSGTFVPEDQPAELAKLLVDFMTG